MGSTDTPTSNKAAVTPLSPRQAQQRQQQQAEFKRALARLDKYSRMTDSQYRMPVIGIRFGIDPILGLIPVLGDFIGLLLSLPVLAEANRVDAPKAMKRKMIFNIVIEAVFGSIPVVGDLFDIYWKANTRNTALLRRWLAEQSEPTNRLSRRDIGALLIVTAALAGLLVLLLR